MNDQGNKNNLSSNTPKELHVVGRKRAPIQPKKQGFLSWIKFPKLASKKNRSVQSNSFNTNTTSAKANTKEKREYEKTKILNFQQMQLSFSKQNVLVWISGLFFVILIAVLFVFVSPFSKIKSINVDVQGISKEEILHDIGLQVGDPIWKISGQKQAISKKATQDKRIENLQLIDDGNGNFSVKITEKTDYGTLFLDGKYYQLDANGVEKSVDTISSYGPTYVNFSKDNTLNETISQFGKLPYAVRRSISQIKLSPVTQNSTRIAIYMNDGNIVLANNDDFSSKLKYYGGIASTLKQASVVDIQSTPFSRPMTDDDQKL